VRMANAGTVPHAETNEMNAVNAKTQRRKGATLCRDPCREMAAGFAC
jgi:hypothetical protein